MILETVEKTQAISEQSVEQILSHLSVSPATYDRWKERAEEERRTGRVVTPRRPPALNHADPVGHVDLMYLSVGGRGYYLADILDGYSRFLVHWSLNVTMTAETVASHASGRRTRR